MMTPDESDIPTAAIVATPLATAELRYEKTDPRLSHSRSAAAWTALAVSMLAPGIFLAVFAHQSLGGGPVSPAWGSALVAVLLGGPVAGLILGITALLLRPRRHFWAAVVATCISGPMLLFSFIALLGFLD
jgi:hypothetical protein